MWVITPINSLFCCQLVQETKSKSVRTKYFLLSQHQTFPITYVSLPILLVMGSSFEGGFMGPDSQHSVNRRLSSLFMRETQPLSLIKWTVTSRAVGVLPNRFVWIEEHWKLMLPVTWENPGDCRISVIAKCATRCWNGRGSVADRKGWRYVGWGPASA